MTFTALILDALAAGLLLIAAGWLSDLAQSRQRRRAVRSRAPAPFGAPHLSGVSAAGAGRSTWAS